MSNIKEMVAELEELKVRVKALEEQVTEIRLACEHEWQKPNPSPHAYVSFTFGDQDWHPTSWERTCGKCYFVQYTTESKNGQPNFENSKGVKKLNKRIFYAVAQ